MQNIPIALKHHFQSHPPGVDFYESLKVLAQDLNILNFCLNKTVKLIGVKCPDCKEEISVKISSNLIEVENPCNFSHHTNNYNSTEVYRLNVKSKLIIVPYSHIVKLFPPNVATEEDPRTLRGFFSQFNLIYFRNLTHKERPLIFNYPSGCKSDTFKEFWVKDLCESIYYRDVFSSKFFLADETCFGNLIKGKLNLNTKTYQWLECQPGLYQICFDSNSFNSYVHGEKIGDASIYEPSTFAYDDLNYTADQVIKYCLFKLNKIHNCSPEDVCKVIDLILNDNNLYINRNGWICPYLIDPIGLEKICYVNWVELFSASNDYNWGHGPDSFKLLLSAIQKANAYCLNHSFTNLIFTVFKHILESAIITNNSTASDISNDKESIIQTILSITQELHFQGYLIPNYIKELLEKLT